ncbi:MAG: hypothetical protein MJ252_03745 [archaeon]|nr:hypothetical protein [archaeon]
MSTEQTDTILVEPDSNFNQIRSFHPRLDKIEDLLKITNQTEMDLKIKKNSIDILKFLQYFHDNLSVTSNFSQVELDLLIYCLKFIDTLNLFMPDQTTYTLSKYMNEIYDIVQICNLDSRDIILKRIKYTQMTIIFYKKKTFKSYYFETGGVNLARELENGLSMIYKTGKFDHKTFKQLQNLFYVVQNKLDESKRIEIQMKMNELKPFSIKAKKQKFPSGTSNTSSAFYDEYNDYDYRGFTNVNSNIYDYNENFFDEGNFNDDDYYSYEYSRGYHPRGHYRGSFHERKKYYENEGREIEVSSTPKTEEIQESNCPPKMTETLVEIAEPNINEQIENYDLKDPRTGSAKKEDSSANDIEIIKVSDNKNYYTGGYYNRKGSYTQGYSGNYYNNYGQSNTNYYSNYKRDKDLKDLKDISTTQSSTSNTNTNTNINTENKNNSGSTANISSPYNVNFKKKIITRKNQKVRGQTLVEVPCPTIEPSSSEQEPKEKEINQNLSPEKNYSQNEFNSQSEISTAPKTNDLNKSENIKKASSTQERPIEELNDDSSKDKLYQKNYYNTQYINKNTPYAKGRYYQNPTYNQNGYYYNRNNPYYHNNNYGTVSSFGTNDSSNYYGGRRLSMQNKKYYYGKPKMHLVEVEYSSKFGNTAVEVDFENKGEAEGELFEDKPNEEEKKENEGDENQKNINNQSEITQKENLINEGQQENQTDNINKENKTETKGKESSNDILDSYDGLKPNSNFNLEKKDSEKEEKKTEHVKNMVEFFQKRVEANNPQNALKSAPKKEEIQIVQPIPKPISPKREIKSFTPELIHEEITQVPSINQIPSQTEKEMDFNNFDFCDSDVNNKEYFNHPEIHPMEPYENHPNIPNINHQISPYEEEMEEKEFGEGESSEINDEEAVAKFNEMIREKFGDQGNDEYVLPDKNIEDISGDEDELENKILMANEELHHVPKEDDKEEEEIDPHVKELISLQQREYQQRQNEEKEEDKEEEDEKEMNPTEVNTNLQIKNMIEKQLETFMNESMEIEKKEAEKIEALEKEEKMEEKEKKEEIKEEKEIKGNSEEKEIKENISENKTDIKENINTNTEINQSEANINNPSEANPNINNTAQQSESVKEIPLNETQKNQKEINNPSESIPPSESFNQPTGSEDNNHSHKYSSKIYTDSVKNMDPQVLNNIKSKINEEFNNMEKIKQQQAFMNQNQIQKSFMHPQMMGHMPQNIPIPQNMMFNPSNYVMHMLIFNRFQMLGKINSSQENNFFRFYFQCKDSAIHREYLEHKIKEFENPMLIQQNISNFENKILIPLYQRLTSSAYKKRELYFYTYNKYKKIISHICNKDKATQLISPYGSFANNFLLENGDIDICIVPRMTVQEFDIYLNAIKEEIIKKDIGSHKLIYKTNRLSLLRILDTQTKFVVDITVHSLLPILNTSLVRLYSFYDQRFHILGLYLKYWAKINKIHGAPENYLSSYALILLLIHFLQRKVEPRILPNLQKIDPRKEKWYDYYYCGQKVTTNIYYEEDCNKVRSYMQRVNNGNENKERAANLLIEFFEYYAYKFDGESVISISNENNIKNTTDYAFSIEDPFDMTHNPGKSMLKNSQTYFKFINAMKKEINFIYSGEYVKRLEKILSSSGSGMA